MIANEKMNIVILGHVDHGKSTLVGRLLCDTNSLPDGKLEQIKNMCLKKSKVFEYAYLLDALLNEQEQGITIDLSRCFFKTEKRKYILLDSPGHVEFLKNMITGASRAEAAVLVIDASEGIKENSKRHGLIASMLGIPQLVICVNKMDLVNYSEVIFQKIKNDFSNYLNELNISPIHVIPVSASGGDNLTMHSSNMKWYKGKNLLDALDEFNKEKSLIDKELRLPLQDIYKFTVNGDNRRLFAGKIESGTLKINDEILFLPSYKKTKVKSIEIFNKTDIAETHAGESIAFTVTEEIYAKRGEIVCKTSEHQTLVGSRIQVTLFWMGKEPFLKNKKYILKLGTTKVDVKLVKINHIIDIENLNQIDNEFQKINRHDIADCILETVKDFSFDLNQDLVVTSRFVIVDDYDIVGGGVIKNRAEVPKDISVNNPPLVLWLTGLSGAGKSTIAEAVHNYLNENKIRSYILDGDDIRKGLSADLGFTKTDRAENIRRSAHVAKLLSNSGQVVICSFISPFHEDRMKAREIIGDNFFEIFIEASIETCKKRDPKGLYQKAINGEIKNFTGISSPFERPVKPDLVINTEKNDLKKCVEILINFFGENYFK